MFDKIEEYPCGLIRFSRKMHLDERGYFSELYRREGLAPSLPCDFVQDNLSFSTKGVLRGLHLQKAPFGQAKLLTCLKGEVFDVVVDLRTESPSFGKNWVFLLKSEEGDSLFVPEGFAHGFCVVSCEALLLYKVSHYYNSSSEIILKWDDQDLGIEWPSVKKNISNKDQEGLSFKDFLRVHK